MNDKRPLDTVQMQSLAASAAESLDGAIVILVGLCEQSGLPDDCRTPLYALCDSLSVCRDRIDLISELLEGRSTLNA